MKKNDNKITYISSILIILGLILVSFSISYALFKGTGYTGTNNVTTGAIKFSYTESSNSLTITDPKLLSDEEALQSLDYFDFNVSTKATGKITIGYHIYLSIDEDYSTISNEDIKVALSKVNSNEETIDSIFPTFISSLSPFNVNTLTYDTTSSNRLLYTSKFEFNYDDTTKIHNYRFRMWIDEDKWEKYGNNIVISGENTPNHQVTGTRSYYKVKIGIVGASGEPITISNE